MYISSSCGILVLDSQEKSPGDKLERLVEEEEEEEEGGGELVNLWNPTCCMKTKCMNLARVHVTINEREVRSYILVELIKHRYHSILAYLSM